MIVTCPSCDTQYRYDPERFSGAASKRLKCPRCATVFEVSNPEAEDLDATSGRGRAPSPVTPPGGATDRLYVEPEVPELPALAPLPSSLRFSLAVIAGPQAGSVFPVTRPRSFLGRGANMDVQLRDTETSRRHAMLEIRGEEATVVDVGSTNGVFVGGERIQRAELRNHEEFTLGSTTLMLIVTPQDEATL